MRDKFLEVGDVPRRPPTKELYHIALQVPHDNFALLVIIVLPIRKLLIGASSAFLCDV